VLGGGGGDVTARGWCAGSSHVTSFLGFSIADDVLMC
jgi:hypothetical protein